MTTVRGGKVGAPKGIPGVEKLKWWHRKLVLEIVSGLVAIGGAAVAAWRLLLDPSTQWLGWMLFGVAVITAVASTIKLVQANHQDAETGSKFEHEGLRSALHVLHAVVGTTAGLDMTPGGKGSQQLRVTLHRVVPPLDNPEKLQQIVDYVGGSNAGRGRFFSVRSGITGRAVRDRTAFTSVQTGDEQARRRELKQEWGYTDHDLQSLTLDRISSMAVPIFDASQHYVLGVVYLDADQPDLFAEAAVQDAVLKASRGIITFVNERYAQ